MWPSLCESPSNKPSKPKQSSDESVDSHTTLNTSIDTCDFELDCIPLFKHIEQEMFAETINFLSTGYWPGSFFADSNPPQRQARTWVTRFDYNEGKQVRWSQLCLHLAIVVEAPLELVRALVELYPQGVRCTDDQQMLPIHLALKHGSQDTIVAYLLKKFPEAVNVRGGTGVGRLPVDYAVRGPNKVLGNILEAFVEKSRAKAAKDAAKAAAKSHAKKLKFLNAKLQEKDYEMFNVKGRLQVLDEEKAMMKRELREKRGELKTSKENIQKLSALKLNEFEESVIRKQGKRMSKQLQDLGDTCFVEHEEECRHVQQQSDADKRREESKQVQNNSEGETEESVKYKDEELNRHIRCLEEHNTGLQLRIEEIEQRLELNRSESRVKEEESGLLEDLGSMLDASIQELRHSVVSAPTPLDDESFCQSPRTPRVAAPNNISQPQYKQQQDDWQEQHSETVSKADQDPHSSTNLKRQIAEIEHKVEVRKAENEVAKDVEANGLLEEIGSVLDVSIQELRRRVQSGKSQPSSANQNDQHSSNQPSNTKTNKQQKYDEDDSLEEGNHPEDADRNIVEIEEEIGYSDEDCTNQKGDNRDSLYEWKTSIQELMDSVQKCTREIQGDESECRPDDRGMVAKGKEEKEEGAEILPREMWGESNGCFGGSSLNGSGNDGNEETTCSGYIHSRTHEASKKSEKRERSHNKRSSSRRSRLKETKWTTENTNEEQELTLV